MAFLQIKSANPDLSFILKKNPASGLLVKKMRRGVVFGYYSNENQTYNIFFKDAFNDISYPEYKNQQFEYVNPTRYNSSQFVLNSLNDMIRDAYKKRTDNDKDGFANELVINQAHMSSQRTLKAFKQHFEDKCTIDAECVGYKQYRIAFETKQSLYYLLNLVNLFAAFNVVHNKKEYLCIDNLTIEKYSNSLAVIDAPYFIRYFFKTTLFRSKKTFNIYKERLETSSRYSITMEFGDTHMMRMDAVNAYLDKGNHIVDVGCGEGRYIWKLAAALKGTTYHAIEPNKDQRDAVARRCKYKGITNLELFDSMDEFLACKQKPGNYDFICSEVIEHVGLEGGADLVRQCLDNPKANTVVITTPNRDFNPHYFDDGLRHSDHVFEFSEHEFDCWLKGINQDRDKHALTTMAIGDTVDGTPTTLGAVWRKKC